jgi:putative transposase
MSYPSDLSEGQWKKIAPFFERPDPRGARPKHDKKRMVEAILYRLREGCRWRALPHDFPPWSTVASHFRLWCQRGVWQEAVLVLGTRWREVVLGRARRAPRHAILDSQSVKTAAEGEERGFHGGKKIKGRSRHVAIDSQGTLLAVRITAANKADGAQAAAVMVQAVERHPSIESFTADQSYQRQAEAAARKLLGRDLHVTAKPASTTQKRASHPSPSAGASNAPSRGWASAACSPRSTKRPSPAPRRGSGAR